MASCYDTFEKFLCASALDLVLTIYSHEVGFFFPDGNRVWLFFPDDRLNKTQQTKGGNGA